MTDVIETERLRLRPFADDLSDLDALHEIQSDAQHMRFYPHPFSREESRAWIEKFLDRQERYGYSLWAIEDRETGEFLGNCGPVPQVVDGVEEIELGWSVTPRRARQGIATEAAAAWRDRFLCPLGMDRDRADPPGERAVSRRRGAHRHDGVEGDTSREPGLAPPRLPRHGRGTPGGPDTRTRVERSRKTALDSPDVACHLRADARGGASHQHVGGHHSRMRFPGPMQARAPPIPSDGPRGKGMMSRAKSTSIGSSDAWKLFLASFLTLFVELALIRWIPGTVHIVGFFTNLVLIASFLGLGIGMARPAPARASVWRFLFRLAIVVAGLAVVHIVDPEVSLPQGGDYGLNEIGLDVGISIPMPLVLVAVFALSAWANIPLGQLVAVHFDGMERIRAYSINIGGSLAGVAAFSFLAWRSLPPEVWFGLALVLVLVFHRERVYAIPIVVIAVSLFALYVYDSDRFRNDVRWSPYYKVVTKPVSTSGLLNDGFVTDVNGQFLLSGLDLRPEASLAGKAEPSAMKDVEMLKSYYSLPFQMRSPGRVLVLGAGVGNDVAAALRNGAEHVTAVEIDPLVQELGIRYHPEKPFDSPRVTPVLDDARALLNRTHERFDLIIFATLDAHGLLSGTANVRLDSFVYTVESLRSARDHLHEDGVVVLSFGPFREDIQLRQYSMMRSVFGRDPIYLLHSNGHRTMIAGATDGLAIDPLPSEWKGITSQEVARGLARYPLAARPATDDWPHLYIRDKRVPTEYVGVLVGILLLSVVLVWRSFRGTRRLDGQFFFLGAGFLLMETKSVTQYALLVGSTWQTNSLVFVVILATILAANLYVLTRLKRPRVRLLYGLLVTALIVSYAWPISRWDLAPGVGAYAAAAAYLGVPILLAAIIFAVAFRNARLGSEALASNLLGAILGGTLEYLSLALGIRALSLLAAAMYLAAFGFWLRGRARIREPDHGQDSRGSVLLGADVDSVHGFP